MEMAKYAANYAPLTPIMFLERTAGLHPNRTSIIYGDLRFTWTQTMARCRRLASQISQLVSVGQTVIRINSNPSKLPSRCNVQEHPNSCSSW